MPKATPLILSFNGGEVSPFIDARPDIRQYATGCRVLENFIPMVEGGVKRAPGTCFVAETKHSDKISRLIPFYHSNIQAYILELGDKYIRFYRNNAQIHIVYIAWVTAHPYGLGYLATNGGSYYRCIVTHVSGTFEDDLAAGYWEETDGATDLAYEIPSPYAAADLPALKYFQSATNTIWLCHPDYLLKKLVITSYTSWTLSDHLCKVGAEMVITDISQALVAVVKAIPVPDTLAAGDIVYIEDVVGMTEVNDLFFLVGTVVPSKTSGAEMNITGITNANPAVATCENVPVTLADGNRVSIKDVAGMNELNDRYFTVAAVTTGDAGHFQLVGENSTNYGSYTSGGTAQEYASGTFELAITDSQLYTAYTSGGTAQECMFGTLGNQPACGTFFEQRMVLAGTNNNPQKATLSKILSKTEIAAAGGEAYGNFTIGPDDSDAMEYNLVSKKTNRILWVLGEDFLILGTVGGIWKLGASSYGEPLTPTNVNTKKQVFLKAKNIEAETVTDSILWVTQSGISVRQLIYSADTEKYIAPDLTRVSKHIAFGATQALSGITEIGFQDEPIPILWAIRADGQLLGLVYEPQEEVLAWFRVVTDGCFESKAIIGKEGEEDQVWVIVNRTIEDATARYVEYFKPQAFYSEIKDCFFVHSGITWDGGDAVAISGITNANPAVVTTTAHHGLTDGELVRIYDVLGMTEVNQGLTAAYTVANKTDHTFELSGITSVQTAVAFAAWVTAHVYSVGTYVTNGGNYYKCVTAHTSGVFASDLKKGYWILRPGAYDGWSTYISGGYVQKVKKIITGLDHLENKVVDILVDGAVAPQEVVASGQITMDWYGSLVYVGLPYTSAIEPMNPHINTNQGSSRGKKQKINKLILCFYETCGGKYGPDADNLMQIPFGTGAQPALFTGDIDAQFDGDWGNEATLRIVQDLPLPMTLLALVPHFSVEDE